MKTIIAISALMFTFGIVNANSINFPSDQPHAAAGSDKSSSALMLDTLQLLSEKTPVKGLDNLEEKVQRKLMDMRVADGNCSPEK